MNWPVLRAGQWVNLPTTLDVRSPFDGRVVGQTTVGQDADFEVAAAAAEAAAPAMRRWPAHARIQTLRAVADALRDDRESLALTLADEAGKPMRDARTEVDRAAFVFDTTAGEIARLGGDVSGFVHPAVDAALKRRWKRG